LGIFFFSLGYGSLVKLLLELKTSLLEYCVGDLGLMAESRRLFSLFRLPLRSRYISFLSSLFSSIRNWYIFISYQ
jgi:hypothetical protein